MVCGNFILPEPASYVFFFALFNLRNLSYLIAKTEAMFDLFNHHFYNDELTRPAITVSPDGGRGAYGWFSVYEIWQASGEAYREINICAEYIDRPISDVAATMLHEMAHLYNLTHEIKDVSDNGCMKESPPGFRRHWSKQRPRASLWQRSPKPLRREQSSPPS